MPLIDTQVRSILREVGIQKKESKESLTDLLESHHLDTDSVLDVLSGLVHNGDSDAIKMRAGEMALKMNGVLRDDKGVNAPVVNFIFQDSQFSINPILLPR